VSSWLCRFTVFRCLYGNFHASGGDHASHDPVALNGMLLVNCLTPALLANGFAARPRARGQGGTIFTSSVEAWRGMPNSVAFSRQQEFREPAGQWAYGAS